MYSLCRSEKIRLVRDKIIKVIEEIHQEVGDLGCNDTGVFEQMMCDSFEVYLSMDNFYRLKMHSWVDLLYMGLPMSSKEVIRAGANFIDQHNQFVLLLREFRYSVLKSSKGTIFMGKFCHPFTANDVRKTFVENIYIAVDGSGLIKIGKTSRNTDKRISELNIANPSIKLFAAATTLKSQNVEKIMHDTFSENRVCGEFFDITPSVASGILREYTLHDDIRINN